MDGFNIDTTTKSSQVWIPRFSLEQFSTYSMHMLFFVYQCVCVCTTKYMSNSIICCLPSIWFSIMSIYFYHLSTHHLYISYLSMYYLTIIYHMSITPLFVLTIICLLSAIIYLSICMYIYSFIYLLMYIIYYFYLLSSVNHQLSITYHFLSALDLAYSILQTHLLTILLCISFI